jgi:hypothetical protein
MKKYNPTDDFFRDALKDHQIKPSDGAKKAFMKDVMLAPPAENRGKKGLILFSALVALVGAGILIWAFNSGESSSNPDTIQVSAIENQVKTNNSTNTATEESSFSKPKQSEPVLTKQIIETEPIQNNPAQKLHLQNFNVQLASVGKHTEKSSAQIPQTTNQATAEPVAQPADETPRAEILPVAVNLPETGTVQNPSQEHNMLPDTTLIAVTKNADSVAVLEKHVKDKTRKRPDPENPWVPSLGVYYTPEWMFNTLEGTKLIHNFGIEGTFHFGRFSVRTGAGLSVAKGTNELVVEYNYFLGAYNKLDSMSFTWNDPIHNFIPKMYTSKKDVWDSLMKLEYARVVKRYTYLQIPMILGYDFRVSELVSIGARMGPVLSVLVTSKQLSQEYDPGTKRIISINDIAPEQVSLNWQLMVGANTAIRLTRSIQFEIEPSVRYYFNSVYEKPMNNAKPWSVGVRAAFVVIL